MEPRERLNGVMVVLKTRNEAQTILDARNEGALWKLDMEPWGSLEARYTAMGPSGTLKWSPEAL